MRSCQVGAGQMKDGHNLACWKEAHMIQEAFYLGYLCCHVLNLLTESIQNVIFGAVFGCLLHGQ